MSRHILSHFIPHGEHVLIGPLGELGSALLWIHVLVSVIVARVVPRLLKSDAERVVKTKREKLLFQGASSSPHFGGSAACRSLFRDSFIGRLESFRPDDKQARGGANERERIAGDQGQCLFDRGIKDFDRMRIDYLRGNDAVAEFSSLRHQNYDVVEPNVSQGPKKRVAMAGEAHVSGLSGKRRARDMSHRASKHILSGALCNHSGKAQARDRNPADEAGRLWRAWPGR